MSRETGKTRRGTVIAAGATLLALLGAPPAQGGRLSAFLETGFLASDNLDRLPRGAEAGGILWNVLGGLEGEGRSSSLAWSGSAGAGKEWIGGREEAGDNTYRANLLLNFPLGGSVQLDARADASRSAETDGSNDTLTRLLKDRLSGEIALSRSFPGGSSWRAGLGRSLEELPGRTLENTTGSLGIRHSFDTLTEMVLTLSDREGRDRDSGRRDGGSAASASLSHKATPRLRLGGEINWAGQRGGMATPEPPRSDNLGARSLLEADLSPTSRLTFGLGAEGMKSGGAERKWGGQGDLKLALAWSSSVSLSSQASHRLAAVTLTDGGTRWSRQTAGEASVEWRPSPRTFLTFRAASRMDHLTPGGSETRENLLGLSARHLF